MKKRRRQRKRRSSSNNSYFSLYCLFITLIKQKRYKSVRRKTRVFYSCLYILGIYRANRTDDDSFFLLLLSYEDWVHVVWIIIHSFIVQLTFVVEYKLNNKYFRLNRLLYTQMHEILFLFFLVNNTFFHLKSCENS